MGSFSDLVIGYDSSDSGTPIPRSGYKEKNQQLDRLRSQVYDLATDLKRERFMES